MRVVGNHAAWTCWFVRLLVCRHLHSPTPPPSPSPRSWCQVLYLPGRLLRWGTAGGRLPGLQLRQQRPCHGVCLGVCGHRLRVHIPGARSCTVTVRITCLALVASVLSIVFERVGSRAGAMEGDGCGGGGTQFLHSPHECLHGPCARLHCTALVFTFNS